MLNREFDKYDYHEALERIYFVTKMIDTMVMSHPVVIHTQLVRDDMQLSLEYLQRAYYNLERDYDDAPQEIDYETSTDKNTEDFEEKE